MPRGRGDKKTCFEKKYGVPPSVLRIKDNKARCDCKKCRDARIASNDRP